MTCPPIILPAFPTSVLGACPNIIGKYIMTLLNIKKNYRQFQKYAPTKCKNFSLIPLFLVVSVKLSDVIQDQLGQQVTCSKLENQINKEVIKYVDFVPDTFFVHVVSHLNKPPATDQRLTSILTHCTWSLLNKSHFQQSILLKLPINLLSEDLLL